MIEIKNHDFSIGQIANSGQCFRINRLGAGNIWQVAALGKVLKIQQTSEFTHTFHCSSEDYRNIWENYFDLRGDYGEIKKSILKFNDLYLNGAVKYGFGLRILRQDVWEVAVSFIISQRNNIPRIKNTIEKLCAPHGGLFPSPQALVKYTEESLRSIGLGYRAKYLAELAKAADSGKFDIEHLRTLGYEEAIKYVKRFNGIGEKVANCIALYGLHKLGAFPVDTWMRRIIDGQYNGKFDIERFPGYAGVVQQYMFFYQRSLKR
ncbi:MAG: hypothetical protein LBS87_01105 [Puniceicoccales bacterium]|jgi:N-glycosylase/DNA lyase|nr:hypothetical protein [Puniceicoccales bacterium]